MFSIEWYECCVDVLNMFALLVMFEVAALCAGFCVKSVDSAHKEIVFVCHISLEIGTPSMSLVALLQHLFILRNHIYILVKCYPEFYLYMT